VPTPARPFRIPFEATQPRLDPGLFPRSDGFEPGWSREERGIGGGKIWCIQSKSTADVERLRQASARAAPCCGPWPHARA